jgi:hypothetical protein
MHAKLDNRWECYSVSKEKLYGIHFSFLDRAFYELCFICNYIHTNIIFAYVARVSEVQIVKRSYVSIRK